MEKIKFNVNKNGKVTLHTEGFAGETCIDEAQRLLQALESAGVETDFKGVEYTQEYYGVVQSVKKKVMH